MTTSNLPKLWPSSPHLGLMDEWQILVFLISTLVLTSTIVKNIHLINRGGSAEFDLQKYTHGRVSI